MSLFFDVDLTSAHVFEQPHRIKSVTLAVQESAVQVLDTTTVGNALDCGRSARLSSMSVKADQKANNQVT